MSARLMRVTEESQHRRHSAYSASPARPTPMPMPALAQATLDIAAMQSTVRILALVAIVACFSLLASFITLAILLFLFATSSQAGSLPGKTLPGDPLARQLHLVTQIERSQPAVQPAPMPGIEAPR